MTEPSPSIEPSIAPSMESSASLQEQINQLKATVQELSEKVAHLTLNQKKFAKCEVKPFPEMFHTREVLYRMVNQVMCYASYESSLVQYLDHLEQTESIIPKDPTLFEQLRTKTIQRTLTRNDFKILEKMIMLHANKVPVVNPLLTNMGQVIPEVEKILSKMGVSCGLSLSQELVGPYHKLLINIHSYDDEDEYTFSGQLREKGITSRNGSGPHNYGDWYFTLITDC